MIMAAEPSGTPLGSIGGEGLGPFGKLGIFGAGEAGGATALAKVTGTISAVIGFMTVAAAIWFLFNFITGGFSWITAAGDKTKLQEAQTRLYNAFIGLIVVIAGWGILALAGQFFGYDILVGKPGDVIKQLKFQ